MQFVVTFRTACGRNPFVIQVNSKTKTKKAQLELLMQQARRNPFVIQVNSKAHRQACWTECP